METAQNRALIPMISIALKQVYLLCQENKSEQAADLTDAVRPLVMVLGADTISPERLARLILNFEAYQARYPDEDKTVDYVGYLKMFQQTLLT